jgi:hypothetical protein
MLYSFENQVAACVIRCDSLEHLLSDAYFIVPFIAFPAQFRDVQEVGQPLSQLVIGTARPPSVPPDEQNSYQTEAHRTTQDLVRSGDDTLESIVRLSGAIAMEGSEAANSLADGDEDHIDDEDVPEFFGTIPFAPPEGSTPPIPIIGTKETHVVLGGRVNNGGDAMTPASSSSLASNLTTAFADLSESGVFNFTLMWWAAASLSPPTEAEETRESISFSDTANNGTPRLTVQPIHAPPFPSLGIMMNYITPFDGRPVHLTILGSACDCFIQLPDLTSYPVWPTGGGSW